MPFDPMTIIMLTALISATVGVLLIFAWTQNRSHRALALWGGADLAGAFVASLLMTRNHAPELISIVLPFGLLAAAYGVIWSASRSFSGRPLLPIWIGAGSALWFAACLIPQFLHSTELRVILISTITAAYTFAAAYELWRGRGERLLSRYPTVVCLALHGVLLLSRIGIALIWSLPTSSEALTSPWVAVMAIEPAILVIVCGFLQLSMAKERSEAIQRRAATTDELTGVANRRAFLEDGERMLKDAAREDGPAALLLLDLDHFKRINDNHGHQAGDRVLGAFARRVAAVLPPRGLFGRVGGEEFAVLLTGANAVSALAIGESIRRVTGAIDFEEPNMPIGVSVSIGVVSDRKPAGDLDDLLRRADQALYRAKSDGRDRVESYRSSSTHPLRAA